MLATWEHTFLWRSALWPVRFQEACARQWGPFNPPCKPSAFGYTCASEQWITVATCCTWLQKVGDMSGWAPQSLKSRSFKRRSTKNNTSLFWQWVLLPETIRFATKYMWAHYKATTTKRKGSKKGKDNNSFWPQYFLQVHIVRPSIVQYVWTLGKAFVPLHSCAV